MKEKGDSCILVGYSTTSKAYIVYNKRTRLIVESIHINFDEIKEFTMASIENNTLGPAPQRQTALDYENSGLTPPLQKTSDHNYSELGIQDHSNGPSSSTLVPNVSPLIDTNAPSLQELEFLCSPLFKEDYTTGKQSVSVIPMPYREMEGKGSGGSKQTPTKNPDAPVTKGEQEAEKKKKANEEAERRRKAMEDKRAAEEQERKIKAEQDRKNTKDAQRLRNEEAERRRRNAEAQGDGCSYKSFLNCKPSEFHRENDLYASYLLKGKVRHWWNMIKIARSDDVASVMKWEEFKDLVATKERKIKRYIWGLKSGIRGLVQQARPGNFQEAVELALMVEKENNRQLKEGDNKRKRENRDADVKKIKPIVLKWKMLGSINRVPFARKHIKGNVGMIIFVIMRGQATRLRNVKLSGFVSNARVWDIRLLNVLFGDSNTSSEVDTENTGSDVDGKENVCDGDGIENVGKGIGEVIMKFYE
ncbi:hypothetical protein Tco_0294404 [Tanacetum coccineum]